MARLSLSGIRKSYGNQEVLHGIDLSVDSGDFVVFVGPSGCGKSTLLRMMAGLEEITSGTFSIDGQMANNIAPSQRGIAMVFQSYALYPHMSVRGNLEYGLKNRGTPRAEIDARVEEAARILEIGPFLERKPRQLSGGQRQRVAMGRAIVRHPKAFLFDEPLSNLDAKLRGQMRVEIKRLQRSLNTTSVYVTHDQLEAMTLADRVVVMNTGRIEQIGKPTEVYERPASLFVAGFVGSPPMNLFKTDELKAEAGDGLPEAIGANTGTIGIRPDAVTLSPNGDPAIAITGTIELIEPVGGESHVYLRLPRTDRVMILVVRGHEGISLAAELTVHLPVGELHQFDGGTGRRID